MLPGIDGIEFINRLSNDTRTSDIPIMFLSTNGDLEDVQKAYNAGADEYLVIPYDPMVLEAKVERLASADAQPPNYASRVLLNRKRLIRNLTLRPPTPPTMARLGDILVRRGYVTPGPARIGPGRARLGARHVGPHPGAPRPDHDGSARRSAGRAVRRAVYRDRAASRQPASRAAVARAVGPPAIVRADFRFRQHDATGDGRARRHRNDFRSGTDHRLSR